MRWYQIDKEEVMKKLGTSEEGLSGSEAEKRLEKYGSNKLPEAEGLSRLKILLHQFTSPLIYILMVAAVVTAFLEEYIDTGVIVAVLVLNAGIGYFQEYKAERSILVGLVISAGVVFNFVSALDDGVSLERARTIAVTTMVLFQFFQAWNSRSELQSVFRINPFSNPFLFYSMVAAFLAQTAVVYVSALQWIFRTESLSLEEWGRILIVSLTVVIAVETDKAIRRHKKRNMG